MKKLLLLLIAVISMSLNSCDMVNNEPPYTLSGSVWESNEIMAVMPGGVEMYLIYVLEFTSSRDFLLTMYNDGNPYGNTISGTYTYNRPNIVARGTNTEMYGQAFDYNSLELYDEYADVQINFFRGSYDY